MADLIKVVADNGVSIFCVVAFVYYIFADKKESNQLFYSINESLKSMNDTQVKMQVNLQQLTDRIEKIEKNKGSD